MADDQEEHNSRSKIESYLQQLYCSIAAAEFQDQGPKQRVTGRVREQIGIVQRRSGREKRAEVLIVQLPGPLVIGNDSRLHPWRFKTSVLGSQQARTDT